MAPPYQRGDAAVWLGLDDAGMRVFRTEVLDVRPDDGSWRVSTVHGTERVDAAGIGPALVPMDDDIAQDLAERGDGFLVQSTVRDIEADLDPSIDWGEVERQIGQERGRGL